MLRVAVTDEGEVARELAKHVEGEVFVADTSSKIYSLKPDVVIHTLEVPYHEVERDRTIAWNLNTWLVINLARAASKVGALNLYVSSFMIFNGRKGYYKETSTPMPLNYYGLTKLSAEMGISALGNFLIIRAGAIYSLSYKGFLLPYIRSLVIKGVVRCNPELYLSPISVRNFSKALAQLLKKGATGVVNVGGKRTDLCSFLRSVAVITKGNVVETRGRRFDFSLDDWLLRTFNIKVRTEYELEEVFHGGLHHEGENTTTTKVI